MQTQAFGQDFEGLLDLRPRKERDFFKIPPYKESQVYRALSKPMDIS